MRDNSSNDSLTKSYGNWHKMIHSLTDDGMEQWMTKHRHVWKSKHDRDEEERRLRDEHDDLRELWEQYQTLLSLRRGEP